MPAGSELEVKLAVPDTRLFDLIATDPELRSMIRTGPTTRSFEALYYDTPGFSLQQSGFAYRVRHEGEDWVATVKSDRGSGGGFSEREEWNEKTKEPEPSLNPFAGTHVGDRLALITKGEKLQLLFSTRFARTALLLQTPGGALIEMAMDRGTIWSGMDGTPIGELELELKNGAVSELLHLAGWVAAHWHLLPEIKSKYARGLELISVGTPGSQNAYPHVKRCEIKEPTPVALINSRANDIFLCQTRLLQQRGNPETIRELRIQCRRMRSLMRFFQPMLSRESGRLHTDRLRQWGALLGSLRDIDVLINAWEKFTIHFCPVFSTSGHWLEVLKERRDFLSEDIIHRICQGELTQQIFELQGFLYQEREKQLSDGGEQPTYALVRKLFLQAVKEIREDIRSAKGTAEIKILHRCRIRVKQLRYVQEALNDISRYRSEEFSAALKMIQSQIGKIHDAYQIKSLLDQFDAGSVDEKFLLEKELFISWRSRNILENLSSLAKEVEAFRRSAKSRLRTLAAIQTTRGTKPRQNPGTHEPGE